jgi:thioredoxin-related protein
LLHYFLALVFIVFIGCSDKKETKIIIEEPKPVVEKIEITNFDKNSTIEFIFKEDKLVSNFNKKLILLFLNNSALSQEQLSHMKRTKKDFFIVKNAKLLDYFNVLEFPSLIILEKNSTKRYNSILPYEVLKVELKD